MTESEIAESLQNVLEPYGLHVQVVFQAPQLQVILNRTTDDELDRDAFATYILEQVREVLVPEPWSEFTSLLLYSRPYGQFEVDWQVELALDVGELPEAIAEPSELEPTELERNIQKLLTSPPPTSSFDDLEANFSEDEDVSGFFDNYLENAVVALTESNPSDFAPAELEPYELGLSEFQPESEPNATVGELAEENGGIELVVPSIAALDLASNFSEDEDVSGFFDSYLETQTSVQSSEFEEDEKLGEIEKLEELEDPEDSQATPGLSSDLSDDPVPHDSTSANLLDVTPPEFVLNQFIFVRNTHLIKTSLPNPDRRVAEAVSYFHSLEKSDKQVVTPLLVSFFKDPQKTSLEALPLHLRAWVAGMNHLDDREFKSVSVWLSRYCVNPEAALSQVNATLEAIAAIEAASQAATPVSPDTESRYGTESAPETENENGAASQRSLSVLSTPRAPSTAGRSERPNVRLRVPASVPRKQPFAGLFVLLQFYGMLVVIFWAIGLLAIRDPLLTGLGAAGLSLLVLLMLYAIGPYAIEAVQGTIAKTRWVKLSEIATYSGEAGKTIGQVCGKYKLPEPRFGISEQTIPFLLSYGTHVGNIRIVASAGLLQKLNEEEIAVVYAHELGHLVNRDYGVLNSIASLLQVFYLFKAVSQMASNRFKDRQGNPNPILRNLGVLPHLCFRAGNRLLFNISRRREYYADLFAAEVTGNPNALARALTKMAYHTLHEAHLPGSDPELLEGLRVLSILDPQPVATTAIAYRYALETENVPKLLFWDFFSPWNGTIEAASSHPLLGKRANVLCEYADRLGVQIEFDMKRSLSEAKRAIGRSNLDGPSFSDRLLHDARTIGTAFGILSALGLSALASAAIVPERVWALLLALSPIGFGIGTLIRLNFRFPGFKQAPSESLLSLLSDVYTSPLRGRPAKLQGLLRRRGEPGLDYGSAFKLQDETGTVDLLYPALFGPSRRLIKLVGQEVTAVGWFHRALSPEFSLKSLAVAEGEFSISSNPKIPDTIWGIGAIAMSLCLLFLFGVLSPTISINP